MKPLFKTLAVVAVTLATSLTAHAAPKQIVVIVAEGLNPSMIDLSSTYIRYGDENASPALSQFKAQSKSQPAPADALAGMKGLLQTAAANGWKTGLVTNADVTQVAPLFYGLDTNGAAASAAIVNDVPLDFLGGGGRAAFGADLQSALKQKGGTALFDVETFEAGDTAIKGKTLALQADGPLSYALDRDAANEVGLGDLTGLAVEKLSEGERPFLLVVHDALLSKAIAAHDTPALFEQLHELDDIVGDLSSTREAKENPANFGIALLATGSAQTPQFTNADATARSNSFFVLSQLSRSFAGAGQILTGADDAKLTAFATDEYKGWKVSDADRAAILAGTLAPEAALRASYEPVLGLTYADGAPEATLYSVGIEGDDALAALKALAATPVK